MNKLMKGAVAGAAGITLLLGGAGTFAVWNATATLSAQTVKSGTLSLAAVSDGVWTDGTTTISDISAYRLIPGKTLTYTQTLNITATGDGLTATMPTPTLSTTGGIAGVTPTLSLTSTSSNVSVNNTTKVLSVNSAGSASVVATITVAMPRTETGGQTSTLTLAAPTFTLTQS